MTRLLLELQSPNRRGNPSRTPHRFPSLKDSIKLNKKRRGQLLIVYGQTSPRIRLKNIKSHPLTNLKKKRWVIGYRVKRVHAR